MGRLSFLARTQERVRRSPRSVLTDHRSDLGRGDADRDHLVGERWTGGTWITAKLVTAGLWSLIVCGPLGLIAALAVAQAPEPSPAQPTSSGADAQAVAERVAAQREAAEFAQGFVVAWLQTSAREESRLSRFGVDTSGLRLPELPATVTNAAVAEVSEVKPDVWSVRVGAEVTWPVASVARAEMSGTVEERDEQPAESSDLVVSAHRQYFQVAVERHGDGLAVQGLPSPVPAPVPAAAAQLGYGERVGPADQVFDTAAGFLRALLTGDGDLTRYVAPDADLVAVTPPPYIVVELLDVRIDRAVEPQPDGSTVRVLVTAVASTPGGQELSVQYPLVMTARDSRWEVAEISPAPLTPDTRTEDGTS